MSTAFTRSAVTARWSLYKRLLWRKLLHLVEDAFVSGNNKGIVVHGLRCFYQLAG
ncbi:hypothetical protein MGSAQ_002066 [marine sediment metagenome]|uniref:Uncharacterized protein n=1 Tax=marine sediment metagenome TaxID=412755 RepID=A0A1B6NSX2_9ZZZZ